PSALARFTDGDTLVPPHTLGLRVQSRTETALLQAMALDPNRRFPDVPAMRAALEGEPPKTDGGERGRAEKLAAAPPLPARHSAPWREELATALAMAVLGVWILQFMLFRYSTDLPQILRLTLGALVLGGLGWFVGDTIFQALTLSMLPLLRRRPCPRAGDVLPSAS
ncbi:MAG TPA: hypothetical protein PLD43_10885, partial [Anaerolineae bacterium]|nr:hypothetical protein [Anaerolineae bacterium]